MAVVRPGTGGLADPASPDAHVSRDAMSGIGHLQVHDYIFCTQRSVNPIALPIGAPAMCGGFGPTRPLGLGKFKNQSCPRFGPRSIRAVMLSNSVPIPPLNESAGVSAVCWPHSARAPCFQVYAIKLLRFISTRGTLGRAIGRHGSRHILRFQKPLDVTPARYARSRTSCCTTCQQCGS